MDSETLAKQALVEHETLKLVMDALHIALDWQAPRPALTAKISSVRFMTQSFQRHLDRLMSMEEDGGYLQTARDRQPHLWSRFEMLRAEHEGFRQAFQQLLPGLEQADSNHMTELNDLCGRLRDLLSRVEAHSQAETSLIQEAFIQDVGGES